MNRVLIFYSIAVTLVCLLFTCNDIQHPPPGETKIITKRDTIIQVDTIRIRDTTEAIVYRDRLGNTDSIVSLFGGPHYSARHIIKNDTAILQLTALDTCFSYSDTVWIQTRAPEAPQRLKLAVGAVSGAGNMPGPAVLLQYRDFSGFVGYGITGPKINFGLFIPLRMFVNPNETRRKGESVVN